MVLKIATLSFLIPFLVTGCVIQEVKPWERDVLAQEKMKLEPNPVETGLDEHIYFSKEAASGGQGVGGGGCGCN